MKWDPIIPFTKKCCLGTDTLSKIQNDVVVALCLNVIIMKIGKTENLATVRLSRYSKTLFSVCTPPKHPKDSF